MSWSERVADRGFSAGWFAIRHLPESVTDWGFRMAADRLSRRDGAGVRRLRANLARVVPDATSEELDALTAESMRRYLRYWEEAFRLPSWSATRINDTFEIVSGLPLLDEAMSRGTGAVMALPHMGNWDHAGAWATLRYGGLSTVAERLRPESLYDRFVAYRETLGMEVLGLGDPEVVRSLARRLKQGKLVCLLADRDLMGRGITVSFMGESASMPAGPAMLALMTSAPLFPVSLWHVEGGTRARILPQVPVPTESMDRREQIALMTQGIADAFAAEIRAHPADWHMMQRLWHADVEEPVRESGSTPHPGAPAEAESTP